MKKLKFITVDVQGMETAILFPVWLKHEQVARCHNISTCCLIRAGFCERGDDGIWYAYGESTSTNRRADEELDSKIINRDYP